MMVVHSRNGHAEWLGINILGNHYVFAREAIRCGLGFNGVAHQSLQGRQKHPKIKIKGLRKKED